jgi:putative FmdB family regulatory protein
MLADDRETMPIYTYRCENCGVQFDRHQSFEEEPLSLCPECDHRSLRKVYLPVGIVFKGSGFYATDHRSPSGQASAKKAEKLEKTESAAKPAGDTVKGSSSTDGD